MGDAQFHAPQKLTAATRAFYWLHSLFELALGRKQRLLQA